MKTVYLTRDFDYRPHPSRSIRFQAGTTYQHVIEAAARAIVTADAGRVVTPTEHANDPAGSTVDARNAFVRKRRR